MEVCARSALTTKKYWDYSFCLHSSPVVSETSDHFGGVYGGDGQTLTPRLGHTDSGHDIIDLKKHYKTLIT